MMAVVPELKCLIGSGMHLRGTERGCAQKAILSDFSIINNAENREAFHSTANGLYSFMRGNYLNFSAFV